MFLIIVFLQAKNKFITLISKETIEKVFDQARVEKSLAISYNSNVPEVI